MEQTSRTHHGQRPTNGIVAIYKPKGPTSHDVIDELRRITGLRTIGHAGTLDPLASGVLVVGIGRAATKELSRIAAKDKEYVATVTLGAESSTDDAEGEKRRIPVRRKPSPNAVRRALKGFCGSIAQIPPSFSAVKVRGQAAYALARAGRPPELGPRMVEVKSIQLLDYRWPRLTLEIVTGPGTYVRAIARDLGRALGTGGYLSDLERTRVGDFSKARALTLEEFSAAYDVRFQPSGP